MQFLPLFSHAVLAFATLVTASPLLNLPKGILLGSSFGIAGQNYTFDYLVIGGGMAGLTVAARLAENTSLLVGVVEAGSFYELTNGNISQVPATDITYAGKDKNDWQPGADWGFATVPQTALLDVEAHYPRGKMLGGSSARNYMTYHAATNGSYNMWAAQVGDDSYTYENFLPYFKKHQNFTEPDSSRRFANATPSFDESFLGTQGPVDVIFPNYANAFGTWVANGLKALGMYAINGFQSGELIGSSYTLATITYNENIRESSETAYLQPVLETGNQNLIIFPLTLGKKVLFDDNKKATGAIVNTQGLEYTINVKREVILSAGTFQSPQLLMVSGVGPADVLTKNGIEVIADRPGVGQNMSDHILFGTTYRVNVLTGSSLANSEYMNEAVESFREGTGPLVNPNVDYFGWEKLPRANLTNSTIDSLSYFASDWPEVEYIAPGGYFGYSTNYQENNPTDGFNYATIVSALVATLSRGSVTINSSDAADPPVIDPAWLSHPADKEAAILAFKRTRQIWQSLPMTNVTIGDEYFPGTANVSTDDEIWTFIQKSVSSVFHAAMTCRMGRLDDPNAVVDSKASVIGVEGLRVVDASALPLLPPGHPMATIYALAEKITDDILSNL